MRFELREITAETVHDVIKLTVAPDQQSFVAPNAVSLAQALFSEEAWFRAAYLDGAPVGFVMVADESQRGAPPDAPRIGLWRLMVDHRHQGRGAGREIVSGVVAHARARGFKELYTSYVVGPGGPEEFYLALGFQPNGEMDEDETVAVLAI